MGVILLLFFAVLGSSQIVSNGGFDNTTCVSTTSCACTSTCTSILPWRVNGTIDIVSRSYIKTFNTASTYSIDLCGTSSGGLTQNITTNLGYRYTVTFMYSGNPLGTISPVRAMRVYVPGGSVLSVTFVSVNNNSSQYTVDVTSFYFQTQNVPWYNGSFSFVATSTLATLKFESANTGQYGILLDYVSATASGVTTSQVTTSPLTTSPLTTSPLTTSPLTSGAVTTRALTSSVVTTSPLTTSPFTTSPLTTSPITTLPITSSVLTSGSVTSSPMTSGMITTSLVTSSQATTSPLTSGSTTSLLSPVTSSPLTSASVTSSPLTSSVVTTNQVTTSQQTTTTSSTTGVPGAISTTGEITTSTGRAITTSVANTRITTGSESHIGGSGSNSGNDSQSSQEGGKKLPTIAIVFGVLGGLAVISATFFVIKQIKKRVNFRRKKFYDEKF